MTIKPFPSIDDFIIKFIEIRGNPFIFYVIYCIRTHYDIQIDEIIKITHKINTFVLSRHQPPKKTYPHSTMFIFIKSSIFSRSSTSSISSDSNQLCKHFTDFIDSVKSRFRRSRNVNLALNVSTRFHLKVISAKHSFYFG